MAAVSFIVVYVLDKAGFISCSCFSRSVANTSAKSLGKTTRSTLAQKGFLWHVALTHAIYTNGLLQEAGLASHECLIKNCSFIFPFPFYSFHQSPIWIILIIPAFWINLAALIRSLSVTEATAGVWECGRRMYQNTDIVLAFFPQLNLLPFSLEGLLAAWRALKPSADYCL